MKVKELQKTVNVAWSPLPQYPIYLAAGSAAQQLDSNASLVLEIYSTNFCDPSYDLELKASLPSQYRFQKLIWSPTGFDSTHRNGLIVGGCEGGHLMIYSAAKMLAGEEGIIARQDKHTGSVRGLDFNPFQPNLLASVASESEIFIWDLNNTSTHMTPGSKTQPLEDVQNVAWNRQVQHILASVFSSRCVIWDLRKNEQIIKLSDTQSRVRWRAVQWHPEVATQVWLASEEDQAPVVQLWDLRYATAPAKTMQIHQRGILGMAWCPRDIDIMISCGKDNRIYCWNPNTEIPEGEILSEVATTSTWYSDVQWCPRNPALIASSSLDGNVSIYSLFGGTQHQVQTSNKIADSFPGMDQFAQAPIPKQSRQITYSDLKRAPKWMKRQRGTKFGFGGKLISFSSKSKAIAIYQVITEPELVERANALDRSLNESNFIEYCRQRADQMPDQNGRYLWYFLKANFELNPKEEMLNLLGYNKDDTDQKFAKYGAIEGKQKGNIEQLTNRISAMSHSDSSEVECDQSTDDNTDLSAENNSISNAKGLDSKSGVNETESTALFKIPTGEDSDSLIAEALLTGNLEAAVELCIESKRAAEALIIASTVGIEFLKTIQSRYLNGQKNELSNIIFALVTRDWMNLICRCTLDSWKEALLAALKHSDNKFIDICEKLGDRLLNESPNLQYTSNAILCYVCAGNVEKLVGAWYQHKQIEKNDPTYKLGVIELQELAEVIMLLIKSLEQQGIAIEPEGKFADFISHYGGLLAAQGALSAALSYIFSMGPTDHPQLDELRDRIYNSVNPKKEELPSNHQEGQGENFFGRQNFQQEKLGSSSYQNQNITPTQAMPNQFNNSVWNSTSIAGPPLAPHTHQQQQPQPLTNISPIAMFNSPPQQLNPNLNPGLFQPKQTNDNYPQPPRPSSVSSQGSNTSHMPRSKYVLDPSVTPSVGAIGGYAGGTSFSQQNPTHTEGSFSGGSSSFNSSVPTMFNTSATNTNLPSGSASQQAPTMLIPSSVPAPMQPSLFTQPTLSFNQYGQVNAGGALMSPIPPMETAQQAMFTNMQKNPTPPPGWNDPPALKSSRQQSFYHEQNEMFAQHAGTRKWQKIIDHSSGEAGDNKNNNNSDNLTKSSDEQTFDSSNNYQFQPQMQERFMFQQQKHEITAITHPLFGYDSNQNQNGYPDSSQYQNQTLQSQGVPPTVNQRTPSGLFNPSQQQNNNQDQSSRQMNFQTSAVQQAQPQQWNTGFVEQPQMQPKQMQLEPLKEKPPIPEEFIYMQTVFEELKKQCLSVAADPRTKRKFVDVAKRLENLYDCLRDGRLTSATTGALNQIVQSIQIGDYGNALATHTAIAFGSDFSQTAGFMPGIKSLVQLASDLKIFLR